MFNQQYLCGSMLRRILYLKNDQMSIDYYNFSYLKIINHIYYGDIIIKLIDQ